MLYNDLVRLNAIDQDIIRQLKRLSALYDERALIMKAPATAVSEQAPLSATSCYKKLQKCWGAVGVDIPKFGVLQPKLAAALDFVTEHQDIMEPGMEIVLIPPQRTLLKAMQHIPAPTVDIQSYKDLKIKPNQAWRCAVVQNPAGRQHVEDVQDFLQKHPAKDKTFSTLSTSAQLVAAAYLQGVPLVEVGTWNLLLADMVSPHEIPCARLIDDRLRFSVDDSAGFLGMNYYYPSLLIHGANAPKRTKGAKKA